ncbi:hypothetical protein BZZ01_07725 [Nostocales cyanobacterium HT-58-2]|nr:hypothetical protein BZZ01_07725 [Nostocales cyanobacterium HT-58-2]
MIFGWDLKSQLILKSIVYLIFWITPTVEACFHDTSEHCKLFVLWICQVNILFTKGKIGNLLFFIDNSR